MAGCPAKAICGWTSHPREAISSATERPYGLLDGRISINPTPDLTFSIWGRNLTNKVYRTNVIAFFGDEASRLGAPRTYGAEVAFKF